MQERPLPGVWVLDDLEPLAKRYLPACIFAWAAGGSERQIASRMNQEAYEDWAFNTRTLIDITNTSLETELFGKTYAAPFGISPMGGAAAVGLKADLKMALAATAENVPFMISGAAGVTYEDAVAQAPNTWPQLYLPTVPEAMDGMVDRVIASGAEVMTVTVDIPVMASAVHSQRLGWSLPIKLTSQLVMDAVTHPWWTAGVALPSFLPSGPRIENMHPTVRPKMFSFKKLPPAAGSAITWKDFERARKRWPGKLVIKGIINPADARRAIDLGADAVMVSNHGGRQVDYALASLRALPGVVAEARGVPVLIDSGFRHGTHVLMALALGARFVFAGRPFLFAAALGGEAGVRQAIGILKQELHRNLALIGVPTVTQVTRDSLTPARPSLPPAPISPPARRAAPSATGARGKSRASA